MVGEAVNRRDGCFSPQSAFSIPLPCRKGKRFQFNSQGKTAYDCPLKNELFASAESFVRCDEPAKVCRLAATHFLNSQFPTTENFTLEAAFDARFADKF